MTFTKLAEVSAPCFVALLASAVGCRRTAAHARSTDGGPAESGDATAADFPQIVTPSDGGAGCPGSVQIHGNLKPLWSKTLGTGYVVAVATDSANDIVVAGSAGGSITIDGQTFQLPPPAGDAGSLLRPFVLKLSANGQLLWHREFSGDGNIRATAVDSSGNVFVTGDIGAFSTNPLDLGTGALMGSYFLAKLDSQGNALWAYAAECSGVSRESVTVDPAGNAAIVGDATDPPCVGSAGTGLKNIFITAFDASGNLQYSKVFGNAFLPAAHFDASGNLFVVGTFQGSLDLGPPLQAPNGSSAFAAKLDSSGQLLWQVADGTYSSASAVAASAAGAFMAGTFGESIGLTHPVAARGPADVFLAGLDANGAPTLEKSIAAGGLQIDALAADPVGGVVLAGRLSSYANLGGGLLAPPGVAFAKFDGSGNPVYSALFPVSVDSGEPAPAPTLAVDTGGNVVIGGAFYGDPVPGTGILQSANPQYANSTPTLFVARYGPGAAQPTAPPATCRVPATAAGLPDGGTWVATGFNVTDMAVSTDSIYWTTGAEVMRAPFTGGAPEPLAIAQNGPAALVLDSNSLYWTNRGPYGGSPARTGSVVSLSLDGGAITTLASGQDGPGALAVDGTSVYFMAGATLDANGTRSPASILSVPRTGGTPSPLVSGLSSQGPLAVNGGVLAFAASASVSTVPTTGGTPTLLATSNHQVASIAIDATNVYWLDASTSGLDAVGADGRVRSVPLQGGGSAVILADNQAVPEKLVLLGSTLFWSARGTGGPAPSNAGLWSLPANGGPSTGLVTNRLIVPTFAVDTAHLAWVEWLDSTEVEGLFVMAR